jgi:hypothetical protein
MRRSPRIGFIAGLIICSSTKPLWKRICRSAAVSCSRSRTKCCSTTSPALISKARRKPIVWKAYIQLTQAEAAFRIQKDQLKVRPIWHQREDRVQAHILVCFLAFALWKSLEMWQQRAGLGNSPRTILEELARIQSHDVVLPTAAHGRIRLRCVTQPDPAQAALLDRLGIVLPKRMRLAEHELPAFARSASFVLLGGASKGDAASFDRRSSSSIGPHPAADIGLATSARAAARPRSVSAVPPAGNGDPGGAGAACGAARIGLNKSGAIRFLPYAPRAPAGGQCSWRRGAPCHIGENPCNASVSVARL